MKIREALTDENISYREFYDMLSEYDDANWDEVNSTDTIKSYIKDMIDQDIAVSHILEAIESDDCDTDDWKIWLGNSMETPEAICSKQELLDALGISDDELDCEI